MNYSDSEVYPGLYAYFEYKCQKSDDYCEKGLRDVTVHNKLPMGKGILFIPGHAIYFNRTASGTELKDNKNMSTAAVISLNGEDSKVKEIYMK